MSNDIIDAHIHLSFLSENQRKEFFIDSQRAGVNEYILGGYNPPDWNEQLKIRKEAKVKTCFGLHPWHIRNSSTSQLEADFTELQRLAKQADLIGETGIDSFAEMTPAKDKLQVQYFEKHLALAAELNKPVVLHIVKAHTEALDILEKFKGLRGIVHGYSGSPELAERYHKLGYFISVGPGLIAEKGYLKLKNTVSTLPLNYFTVESDSPHGPEDITPEPSLLLQVAQAMAIAKKVDRQKVLSISNENLRTLFKTR